MAKEEKKEHGGDDAAQERTGKPLVKMLLLLTIVAAAGGGGFAAALLAGAPDSAEAEDLVEDEFEDGGDDVGYEYIPFEPVTVNLNEDNSTRYLRTTLVMAIRKDSRNDIAKITKAIAAGQHELTNALTVYLSGRTLDDVRGEESLNRIRRAIKDKFNNKLWGEGRPRIDQILFKEFKVQ